MYTHSRGGATLGIYSRGWGLILGSPQISACHTLTRSEIQILTLTLPALRLPPSAAPCPLSPPPSLSLVIPHTCQDCSSQGPLHFFIFSTSNIWLYSFIANSSLKCHLIRDHPTSKSTQVLSLFIIFPFLQSISAPSGLHIYLFSVCMSVCAQCSYISSIWQDLHVE